MSMPIDVGAVTNCDEFDGLPACGFRAAANLCGELTRICVISSLVVFRCSQTATNLQLIAKRARDVSRRGFLEEITFSLRFHVACENTKKETKTQMNNLLSQS